ncbi:MAG: hypothetical protein WBB28_23510 [Crinalium sp.]
MSKLRLPTSKTKKIIHVNQYEIRANGKDGANRPVLTIKQGKNNIYGHEAYICDSYGNAIAKVIYRPYQPLSCGAKCWVETCADVEIVTLDGEDKPQKLTKPTKQLKLF